MSESPFRGAFPHQHHDPRGLLERIQAQIQERIEEAVEMAALELMVALRQAHGRPAPQTSSAKDREEFLAMAGKLLAHLGRAFRSELPDGQRGGLGEAERIEGDERARILAGQVFLARRLPDYWQRFEAHVAAYREARLSAPGPRRRGLGRLLGRE
jgi:hypothetical protein